MDEALSKIRADLVRWERFMTKHFAKNWAVLCDQRNEKRRILIFRLEPLL